MRICLIVGIIILLLVIIVPAGKQRSDHSNTRIRIINSFAQWLCRSRHIEGSFPWDSWRNGHGVLNSRKTPFPFFLFLLAQLAIRRWALRQGFPIGHHSEMKVNCYELCLPQSSKSHSWRSTYMHLLAGVARSAFPASNLFSCVLNDQLDKTPGDRTWAVISSTKPSESATPTTHSLAPATCHTPDPAPRRPPWPAPPEPSAPATSRGCTRRPCRAHW